MTAIKHMIGKTDSTKPGDNRDEWDLSRKWAIELTRDYSDWVSIGATQAYVKYPDFHAAHSDWRFGISLKFKSSDFREKMAEYDTEIRAAGWNEAPIMDVFRRKWRRLKINKQFNNGKIDRKTLDERLKHEDNLDRLVDSASKGTESLSDGLSKLRRLIGHGGNRKAVGASLVVPESKPVVAAPPNVPVDEYEMPSEVF